MKFLRKVLAVICLLMAGVGVLSSQNKPKDVDAFYLGNLLSGQFSIDDMNGLCEYYGFVNMLDTDSVREYQSPRGDNIRFSLLDRGKGKNPYPKVEIKVNTEYSDIEDKVIECGYRKEKRKGSQYNKTGILFIKEDKISPTMRRCIVYKEQPLRMSFEIVSKER